MTGWAARYVGAPYVDRGRGPVGFDCWGLVRAVLADQAGADLPEYGDISARDLVRVARQMKAGSDSWPWLPVEVPQALDVVVMRAGARSFPGHVGIMIDATTVLHSEDKVGAHLAALSDPLIRDRILSFRRYAP